MANQPAARGQLNRENVYSLLTLRSVAYGMKLLSVLRIVSTFKNECKQCLELCQVMKDDHSYSCPMGEYIPMYGKASIFIKEYHGVVVQKWRERSSRLLCSFAVYCFARGDRYYCQTLLDHSLYARSARLFYELSGDDCDKEVYY